MRRMFPGIRFSARWAGRRPRRTVWFLAAALAVLLVLLLLTTGALRSSRATVRGALAGLAEPTDREVRFLVDVRADPKKTGPRRYHQLHFRAGPGPLFRSGGALPSFDVPFQLFLARRGVTLRFSGSGVLRDGAGYLRITEMPTYKDLAKTLEGRWLQVSDRREPGARPAQAPDLRPVLAQFLTRSVLQSVAREEAAGVRGVSARRYTLQFRDEPLRAALRSLADRSESPAIARNAARYAARQLEQHRLERVVLWIRPRTHQLVRARIVLTPRSANSDIQRVVFDATVLPLAGVPRPPEPPSGAVRLRPETIQKLLSGVSS